MQVRRLGRTGLKVSELCLGTMTFGNQADEQTSFAIMDRAYEAGVFFFDTADVYPVVPRPETVGRSEEIVGRWLRGKREKIVLATKLRGKMGPGPNDAGLSRAHTIRAVEDSLRRLGTDSIDLYQVHSFDPETPLEETLRALDALVHSGKVRYIGCSNFAAWQLMKALGISERLNLARFDSVQPRYNLFDRQIERELLPLCEEEGVGVIPYSPLGGGLLTGKYRRGNTPPPESRYILFGRESQITESVLDGLDALAGLAQEKGVSMAQLALAWVLANPTITSPIVGATRPEQLDDSLPAVDVKLSEEELARCREISRIAEGRREPAGSRR
jgi:aryl-alcohol dehydrogenase-like predicted oxidoreductase